MRHGFIIYCHVVEMPCHLMHLEICDVSIFADILHPSS